MREPVELRRVRVRHAAGRHFADLVVGVAPDKAVGQAHATADAIEDLVAGALGNADVVVHVEPAAALAADGGLRERATAAALTVPEVREVHNVRVMHVADGHELSLHVKLPRELSLAEAHDVIERLEAQIHGAVPELGQRPHPHRAALPHGLGVHAALRRHGQGARGGRGGRARDHGRAARRRSASATRSAAASRS